MRRAHRSVHAALAFLVVGALGVGAPGARAQSQTAPKSPTTKHPTSTHHSARGKSTRQASVRERGQKAPAPERISEIQTALSKDGSFAGTPNGKWDDATVDAMKKFQESHGLSPTGKLDAKTLQKLGLGSQTAGVAPPTPPVSSSSLVPGVGSNPAARQRQ
jgi:peptidoglycan hydrolase-like protein with peptidoglycan-binding domain